MLYSMTIEQSEMNFGDRIFNVALSANDQIADRLRYPVRTQPEKHRGRVTETDPTITESRPALAAELRYVTT